MNTSTRFTQPNSKDFLPLHTTKVIERKTELVNLKDGSTVRSMTEIIVIELNDTLIFDLMRENQALKCQLQNIPTQGFWTAENITGISLSAASLFWSILK